MAEIKLDTPMTRRNFIKWGAGMAVAGVAALEGKKLIDTAASIVEHGPNPVSNPVNEGDAILLMVDGDKRQTIIHYAENPIPLDRIRMRIVAGKVMEEPFENGKTKIRDLGEIINYSAVPLTLNAGKEGLLPEGTKVHYVVTTGPVQTLDPPERYLLDVSAQKGLYGIKVITSYTDGINDPTNPPPMETNSRPMHASQDKVGEGWAIGYPRQDGSFDLKGYIEDARIFKPAAA